MTKKEFIKRVEDITEYENIKGDIFSYDFSFMKRDNVFEKYIYISKKQIESISEEMFCASEPIPNEWLIPLGQAIKEYYEDK